MLKKHQPISEILNNCQSNHNPSEELTEIYEKSSTIDELEGGWRRSFIFLGSSCKECLALIQSHPEVKFLFFSWASASKWLDERS